MSARWFPDSMPAPAVSRDTLPWWQAAAEHHLVIQRCARCGHFRHPPGPVCPRCRSLEHEWQAVSGDGTVYTYTIVHQALLPDLARTAPYVVAAVELDGANGVRLLSNLVDVDPADVRVGLPVQLVWEDMGPAVAVPRFRPAPAKTE